jgi:hypothetical protein
MDPSPFRRIAAYISLDYTGKLLNIDKYGPLSVAAFL